MGVFGGSGLAWSMANPQFGAEGAPIMWLRVTPIHCALMLGVGVLTIFASLGRTAVVFSRVASIGWLGLMIVCIVASASHAPGPLGFDSRDSILYGALVLYNLALVLWFTVGVSKIATTDTMTVPQGTTNPEPAQAQLVRSRPRNQPERSTHKHPDAVTTR